MAANNDFWAFAAWSALLAVASAAGPLLLGMVFSLVAGVAWIIVVGIALRIFRHRALWFLLGAPVALAQPFIFAVLIAACLRGDCI